VVLVLLWVLLSLVATSVRVRCSVLPLVLWAGASVVMGLLLQRPLLLALRLPWALSRRRKPHPQRLQVLLRLLRLLQQAQVLVALVLVRQVDPDHQF
jgi:hypothetical protein